MKRILFRRLTRNILAVFALLLFSVCIGQASIEAWPIVVPLKQSMVFPDARKAEARFTIVSGEGKLLYLMECHTSAYEGDPDFDYSGDFECRLTSKYSKEVYSTLLTDNPQQRRDWQSRGRFLAEELVGKCADYPEYGRVRHFRLRGMKLTLAMSDLKFKANNGKGGREQRPQLNSFRFDIQVEPDSTAKSAIAEPAPFAEPPRTHPENPKDTALNCEVVKSRR